MRTFLRVLPWAILGVLLCLDGAWGGDFSCTKPVSFPDRWDDVNLDGLFDGGDVYDPATTGYAMPGDLGLEITLHAGSAPEPVVPGQFFIVDLPPLGHPIPPLTGAGSVAHWFDECPPYPATAGDSLLIEPASVAVHELMTGLKALIAADSTAYWDESSGSVQGSLFAESPRSIIVVAHDPSYPPQSGRNNLIVRKVIRVFVESTGSNSTVTVRFQDAVVDVPTPARAITWGRLKAGLPGNPRP
jgi:hypothetical protein